DNIIDGNSFNASTDDDILIGAADCDNTVILDNQHNGTGGSELADSGTGTSTVDITFKEYVSIPIEWALDGTTPPDAAQVLTSTHKIVIRQFQGATANQDVLVPWSAPHDLTGGTIKFRVRGYVSHGTAPATGETIIFTLDGSSVGDSEFLSKALSGAAVSVTLTADASYVQYDRWSTPWSTALTVTDLAADEDVMFQLIRDQGTDTYAQKIGAAWLDIEHSRNITND
ncbi:unnamed protein product, partial [marine sediment metagenome]